MAGRTCIRPSADSMPGGRLATPSSLDFHGGVFEPSDATAAFGNPLFSRVWRKQALAWSMTDLSESAVPTRRPALVFPLGPPELAPAHQGYRSSKWDNVPRTFPVLSTDRMPLQRLPGFRRDNVNRYYHKIIH